MFTRCLAPLLLVNGAKWVEDRKYDEEVNADRSCLFHQKLMQMIIAVTAGASWAVVYSLKHACLLALSLTLPSFEPAHRDAFQSNLR